MPSNSPYLDALLGKGIGVQPIVPKTNAAGSNLPPFDIALPPDANPEEEANKIVSGERNVSSGQSPYLDALLSSAPKSVEQPTTPTQERGPDIDVSKYNPTANPMGIGLSAMMNPVPFMKFDTPVDVPAETRPPKRDVLVRKEATQYAPGLSFSKMPTTTEVKDGVATTYGPLRAPTPEGFEKAEVNEQFLSSGKFKETFIERGLRTLYGVFGKDYTNKITEGAAAQALIRLGAKEAGIPLSEYRQSPEMIEQAANAFTSSMTLGLAPVVKELVTGEVDYEATSTSGYIGNALGSLAGLYTTPLSLSKKFLSPVLEKIPHATEAAPIAHRIMLTALHDAAVLGPAMGMEQVGEALRSYTFSEAAGKIWDATKSGALVGTIFGVTKGALPKDVTHRLARITTGLVGLNAYRAMEVGGNPFTDRNAGEVIFDILLDTVFLWRGLPSGKFLDFERKIEEVVKKADTIKQKETLIEQIPEAALKRAQEEVLKTEKQQLALEAEKTAKDANDNAVVNVEGKEKTIQVNEIKKTGEAPIPAVFKNMPEAELINQADLGVEGAKRELARRAKERPKENPEDQALKEGYTPTQEDLEVPIIKSKPEAKPKIIKRRAGEAEKVIEPSKQVKPAEQKPLEEAEVDFNAVRSELNEVFDAMDDIVPTQNKGKLKKAKKMRVKVIDLQQGQLADVPATWHDGTVRYTMLRQPDGSIVAGEAGSYDTSMMKGSPARAGQGTLPAGYTAYFIDLGPGNVRTIRIYRAAPNAPTGKGSIKKKKPPRIEADEITTDLPVPLKTHNHPFRNTDMKKVVETQKVLADSLRTSNPDIEIFTSYLTNEVNRYLNGGDVQIDKVRAKLSELATRSDSFRSSFERTEDFNLWKDRISEAAKWGRTADRVNQKGAQSDFKLTSGIDPTEFFDRIKRLHPAPFPLRAQKLLADIADQLKVTEVLDIFGGVGKIGGMKKFGYEGTIRANEIEPKWGGQDTKKLHKDNGVDFTTIGDSRKLKNKDNSVQAIFTSPTYGNLMGSKSPSKKDSYQAFAGGKLGEGNTGGEVWGPRYEALHKDIYKEAYRVVKPGGYFVLNMKDKPVSASNQKNNWIPKKGSTVAVEDGVMKATDWHIKALEDVGFKFVDKTSFEEAPALTHLQKFGRQYTVGVENVAILQKPLDRSIPKRTAGDVQLNMMIPINEVPERVAELLKDMKAMVNGEIRSDTLYRNRRIWEETGYWAGKDGKWRYEISPEEMKIRPSFFEEGVHNIDQVIDYPSLYKAVPEVRNISIELDRQLSVNGRYNSNSKKITLKSPKKGVLEHEFQHAVNDVVGSSFTGSNVRYEKDVLDTAFFDLLEQRIKDPSLKRDVQEYRQQYYADEMTLTDVGSLLKSSAAVISPSEVNAISDIVSNRLRKSAIENYRKNPGEMEARLTKLRMDMTPEQRKAEAPWETLDHMLGKEAMEGKYRDTPLAESVDAGFRLYSGIDITEGIKTINKGIRTIRDAFSGEERVRIDPNKVDPKYRSVAEGGNEWMDAFDASRDAKKFDLAHFMDRLKFRSYRAIHEQRGQLRNELMKFGKAGYKAVQYIDAEQASTGIADRMYFEMRQEAFRDVPSHLTKAVDAVDLVNRLTDIYGYKTTGEFKPPKGMSAENTAAAKELLDVYMKLTPEERAIAERASKVMDEHVKRWVDEMVEVELKSEEEGELLKSHKYRKMRNLNIQDIFDIEMGQGKKLGDNLVRSTDSGVDRLASEAISLLETESRILYKETANRIFNRIQKQRTRLALEEYDKEFPNNPFVRFRGNDSKENKRAIPDGWYRDYYFKNGKPKVYYIHPDAALQLLGSGPHMSYELSRVLRTIAGVNLTRALTVSTSALWATTRGLTMDIAHTFFSARRVREVKNEWGDTIKTVPDNHYERLYSSFAPKFLGEIGGDMKEVFADVMTRGPITGAYEKAGGTIPFLTLREQKYLGRGTAVPSRYNKTMDDISYWGQSMEMLNRVAVMHRHMKNLAVERGITVEEAYKSRDLVMEATNIAVERLPYRQGGWLPKELDKIIGPFISAGYNASRTFGRSFTENPIDFAARLSNLAIPTVGMTIGMALFADHIDRDIPESMHVGSIVIPLPFEAFSFLDENGDKRYMLLRIPVDPNVAALYNIFRLATKKAMFEAGLTDREPNYEAIIESITRSLPTDSPIGPSMAAWLAYFGNINTWKMNKIVPEVVSHPNSNVEGMDKPERYGQLSKDIADATGLSAPRLEAAAKQFGMPNNEYAWLFGKIYDNAISDLDPKIREEHLAQSLAKTPGVKNLFAVTTPRAYRRADREQMDENEVIERMRRNNQLISNAKNFYWRGVGSESEIDKYIDSFEEKEVRDSMERQRKFIDNIKSLPHRDTWVYNFNKTPEFKAEDYYKIWKVEKSPEERAALDRELDELMLAGYVSKSSAARFWQKFDDLVFAE